MEIATVGLDLAKNVFQVHGVNGHGKIVLRKLSVRPEIIQKATSEPAFRPPHQTRPNHNGRRQHNVADRCEL